MILDDPAIFRIFQKALGSHKCAQVLTQRYLKLTPGSSVLDLGCSAAEILSYLPDVRYTGVDMDSRSIDHAKKRYGDKGLFIRSDVHDFLRVDKTEYDTVMAIGFLHHLDDASVKALFLEVKKHMHADSRLITVDGCREDGQSFAAQWLLNNDRGNYVRTKEGYRELADVCFENVQVSLERDLLRVPYTHCIMEITT